MYPVTPPPLISGSGISSLWKLISSAT